MDGEHSVKAAPVDERALMRKVGFRFMPLIMICYFFAFFDRINIGFAKSALQADLGLSNTAYGLGASLFVIGYVIFEVPSNMILFRVGARRWIARIMFTWGLATIGMMFVNETWHFYLLRFIIGSMEAGFAPGVLYFYTIWYPAQIRGRITSAMFVASAFSTIVGAPIAGLIMEHANGLLGLSGWRWMFIFGGVPCLVLAAFVWNRFDDRISDAKWLGPAEKAALTRAVGDVPTNQSHSLFGALRAPGFLLLALIYFLIQIASYGLNFWGPDLIRTAMGSIGDTRIGLLTATPFIGGAICMVVFGRHADKTGHRVPYVLACLLIGAVGFIGAGLFAHTPLLLMLSICAIGTGVVASIPMFWTLPARLLAGAGAASGIALISTLGQMGGIVSPIVIGRVKDVTGSATPALYLISGVCVAAALILAFLSPIQLRAKDRGR
jgi:MFS family permease